MVEKIIDLKDIELVNFLGIHNNNIQKIESAFPKTKIVLDPFIGSGTTAVTAKSLNRDYIGCELNNDYTKLIMKRLYG